MFGHGGSQFAVRSSQFAVRSSRFTVLGRETRQADGADVTYGTHETYVRCCDPPTVDECTRIDAKKTKIHYRGTENAEKDYLYEF
jgi:hypothetical protein